jgi:SNF2 family DNA or RNA helicase
MRDVGRLLSLAHGANFSVPGAGKTTSLLACYEALRARDGIDRLLVVAPKNAFLAWEDEVTECFPDPNRRPSVRRIAGGATRALAALDEDPEIALITYQFLPNVLTDVKLWSTRNATHIVLDESHRAKSGANGVYALAALQLSGTARRRDILSGTPMPNSPEDLRAQIEFLWPGQRILPETKLRTDSGDSTIREVQQSVAPLYVRTTKRELQLPPLSPTPVHVELGPLQRELYELLRSEAKRIAHKLPAGDMRLLRKLGQHVMVMLEAASNPMLLASLDSLSELRGADASSASVWELLRECAQKEQPAKVAKVVELVDDALASNSSHKVLIWTSFVQNVLLLERLLARHGPVTLYGAIATGSDEDFDTREGRIRRFHEDQTCRVMIANPAACGEGISLHRACHHAIYLDRTFNAAHYLQSIDRIHRLGLRQDVPMRVDILEARWTIDIRIAKRLKSKIDSMSTILNDPGLAALAYDPLDVVEEFPGGIQADDLEDIIDHIANGETEGT